MRDDTAKADQPLVAELLRAADRYTRAQLAGVDVDDVDMPEAWLVLRAKRGSRR